MTAPAKPTISYGHAFLDDCTSDTAANWAKVENGQTLAALVVVKDDVFDAEATASGGSKEGYWDTNLSNLSSDVYTKCRYRVKCGNASVKVKIRVVFNDATTQDILTDTNTTVWKAGIGSITPGKTIIHIRFFVNNAVGHVYVDFLLIYKNDFTLPNTEHGITFTPSGRFGMMEPVGMVGAHTQNLGSELAIAQLRVNLDIGTWLRAGDVINGEVFLDIEHNSKAEDFQWLTMGDLLVQFKATVLSPQFIEEARESTAEHTLHIDAREYRRSDASDETYAERFGLT